MNKIRLARTSVAYVFGFALGVTAGCDPEQDCQTGTEGCGCRIDGGCLDGLACLSQYCVDPSWVPPSDDPSGGSDDGAADSAADAGGDSGGGDGDGGSTAPDNVGACEDFVAEVTCGDFDFGNAVQCDAYADLICDVSDYFDCLRDNTSCLDGIPDSSGWQQCASLAQCD